MKGHKFNEDDVVYEAGRLPKVSQASAVVRRMEWVPRRRLGQAQTGEWVGGYWQYYLDWPGLKDYGPYAESELSTSRPS